MKAPHIFRDVWMALLALALLLGGAWVFVYGALLAWAVWTGQL